MSPIKIDNLCPELESRGYHVESQFRNDGTVTVSVTHISDETWRVTCDGEQAFRRALLEFATSIGLAVEWPDISANMAPPD